MRTTKVWIMVLFVIQLGVRSASSQRAKDVDYDADICNIRLPFSSPYVKAYLVKNSPETICNHSVAMPRRSASRGKEIHVLFVHLPSSNLTGGQQHQMPQVVLNIVTSNENATRKLELFFILASNQSLRWKIASDCVKKAKRSYFWTSNSSQLIVTPSQTVKTEKFETELPDVHSLKQWALEKFKHEPIITEHEFSRKINISVGLGNGKQQVACNKQVETPQDTKGCVVPTSRRLKDKEVHIIELEAHDAKSPRVVLNIHPKSHTTLRCEFLLVLKSHSTTQWVVQTTRLRGVIDIVTDQSVDTNGIDMESVRVVNERLSNLSESHLVSWTAVNYGAPMSYTSAAMANRFDLTVNGVDDRQHGLSRADDASGIIPIQDRLKVLTGQLRSVYCAPGELVVSLLKRPLKSYMPYVGRFSLIDSDCVAQQNHTHYFWMTTSDACGTVKRHQGHRVVIENAILIRLSNAGADRSSDNFVGSGMKSLDDVDETFSDDEDAIRKSTNTVRLDFSCSYSSETDFSVDVAYFLQTYKDVSYQHEIISFPAIVRENQPLYIVAGVHADQALQVRIHNCNITAVDNLGSQRRHPLIINGCAIGQTVTWKDGPMLPDAVPGEKFEFIFRKWWEDQQRVDLSCDLTVCTRHCLPSGRYCSPSNMRRGSQLAQSSTTRIMRTGPFVLHSVPESSSTGITTQVDGINVVKEDRLHSDDADDLCNQLVRVDGLDSPTVIGIAFAAFLIGTLLSGTLWYIHSRTVPSKKRSLRRRSAETSGESTPSSTAPITVCKIVNQV